MASAACAVIALLTASSATALPPWIGRASLDGSNADYSLVPVNAGSIAVDSGHLYWTNAGTRNELDAGPYDIGRVNLDGTGADPSFISDPSEYVGSVAVDGSHIYWAHHESVNEGTIGRANLDGSGVDPSFINPPWRPPDGIAVDSEHIYWTLPFGHSIARANLDGTGVDPDFIVDHSGSTGGGVAVNSTHIYWLLEDQHQDAWIARANLDGTGVESRFIAAGFSGVGSDGQLTADSAHIYWSTPDGVVRANIDGTEIDREFIPFAAAPWGPLGVDPSHLYWGSPRRTSLFTIGKPKRHPKVGTARLPVTVLGPGKLVLEGKGLRRVAKTVDPNTTYRLLVKPKRAKARKLRRKGNVRVRAKLTLALPGTEPAGAQFRSLKLIHR